MDVASTIAPNPAVKTVVPQLLIVTVFDPWPLAIVTVPVDGVLVLLIDWMLTKTPAPGLVAGKDVSLSIGTNPPTSSIRSTILALIAPVVAIFVSPDDHVSPDDIVSVESCLKYLASEADVVNNVVSLTEWPECSEFVTNTASAILAAVTASSAIFAVVTLESAILAVVTLASVILEVITESAASFADATEPSGNVTVLPDISNVLASLSAVTAALVILAVVTAFDLRLPESITSNGIELFVWDNAARYITKVSLCKEPESQVTFTVVFVENDEPDIVPTIVPVEDPTALILLLAW